VGALSTPSTSLNRFGLEDVGPPGNLVRHCAAVETLRANLHHGPILIQQGGRDEAVETATYGFLCKRAAPEGEA
jgi:hypothetical protein